jgi:hypothetical protein
VPEVQQAGFSASAGLAAALQQAAAPPSQQLQSHAVQSHTLVTQQPQQSHATAQLQACCD